jgi:hypothetical protein
MMLTNARLCWVPCQPVAIVPPIPGPQQVASMVTSRRQSTAAGRKRRASELPAAAVEAKRKPDEAEAPREVRRRIAREEKEELHPVSHASHGKVGHHQLKCWLAPRR